MPLVPREAVDNGAVYEPETESGIEGVRARRRSDQVVVDEGVESWRRTLRAREELHHQGVRRSDGVEATRSAGRVRIDSETDRGAATVIERRGGFCRFRALQGEERRVVSCICESDTRRRRNNRKCRSAWPATQ